MRSWKWERGGWCLGTSGSMSKGTEGARVCVWGGALHCRCREDSGGGGPAGRPGGPLRLAWADGVESRDSLKLFDREVAQSQLCEDNGNPQPFPRAHCSLLTVFTCLTSIRHNITPCCQYF